MAGLAYARELKRLGRAVLLFDKGLDPAAAEQVSHLLISAAPDFAVQSRAAISAPRWTLMMAFFEALAASSNCRRDQDGIESAAHNSSKPSRIGPARSDQ